MSTPFYDLASLVVVPSGYKSGKIYAQKPLTTDGQLTFTRASTATRVNASGLIESVASGVPRLDYLNSTCPRLLLEPQRTNVALYSEQFDNAYWTKTASTTITANTTISPDGYQNADTIAFAGSGDSINLFVTTGLSVVSGTTFTLSVFTKSTTQVVFFGGATGGTGTNVYNGAVDYGNGWYRQSVTRTWSASGTVSVQLVLTLNAAGSTILYGFQAELGAYATSYIPTTSAAVTRLADVTTKTGISSLIGQTEGTFFAEFTIPETQNPSFFSISDGTGANRVIFGYYNGVLRYYTNSSTGSFSDAGIIDAAPVVGQTYKIAIAYKNNDFKVYKNGTNTNTLTTFTVPASLTTLDNQGGNVGQYIYAGVKQLLLFKTRLTNAQLAELTTL